MTLNRINTMKQLTTIILVLICSVGWGQVVTVDYYPWVAGMVYGASKGPTAVTEYGQSFTCDNDVILDSCKFYLYKSGTPTGKVCCKLYAHSGTYGTSSLPNGAALVVSDSITASSLPIIDDVSYINFNFTNKYRLTKNTYYLIILYYYNGDASNYVNIGTDISTLTHDGNRAWYNAGVWQASSTRDVVFYIYGAKIHNNALLWHNF